jgi:hypothetical protein
MFKNYLGIHSYLSEYAAAFSHFNGSKGEEFRLGDKFHFLNMRHICRSHATSGRVVPRRGARPVEVSCTLPLRLSNPCAFFLLQAHAPIRLSLTCSPNPFRSECGMSGRALATACARLKGAWDACGKNCPGEMRRGRDSRRSYAHPVRCGTAPSWR